MQMPRQYYDKNEYWFVSHVSFVIIRRKCTRMKDDGTNNMPSLIVWDLAHPISENNKNTTIMARHESDYDPWSSKFQVLVN